MSLYFLILKQDEMKCCLLFFGQIAQLSPNRATAVIFRIAIAQSKMGLEGVPFPPDELRHLGRDVRIGRVRESGNAGINVLVGHFQIVATAASARHFDFFRCFLFYDSSRSVATAKDAVAAAVAAAAAVEEAASAPAGRDRDLTRLENVPREIFKQIETTQL